jgi:DNA-binding FadR family transcriptional regulator
VHWLRLVESYELGIILVVELLRTYVEGGPGTKLPPERLLANELGVSRSEIRKGLLFLEREGLLSRQVGRGTFVNATQPKPSDEDGLKRGTSPREAMEARLLLEPELAGLAALNANFSQIEEMQETAGLARQAKTWTAYEELDARLHRFIATAAGNRLLLAVHEIVNDVRRAVIWKRLDTRPLGPPDDYSSFEEHDAIVSAIEGRDRNEAMEAMRRHLRTTSERLFGSPR